MSNLTEARRPGWVTEACAIIGLTIVVGIWRVSTQWELTNRPLLSMGNYAMGTFLVWLIFSGRNWARWFFAVLIGLAVWGFLSSEQEMKRLYALPPLRFAWVYFQSLLSPVAVVLLFLPESNRWFRLMKKVPRDPVSARPI